MPQPSDTLGWIHYRMGRARDALPLLAECVDLQPKNPVYRFHLGMAYLGAGMSARAREQLQEAVASPTPFDGRPEAEQAIASLDRATQQ
jgi:predicted Zn-dependent protease